MINLITNAIEAIGEHGEIVVIVKDANRVNKHGTNEPMIQIEVNDTGYGISKDRQKEMALPYQSQKRSKKRWFRAIHIIQNYIRSQRHDHGKLGARERYLLYCAITRNV